LPTIVADPVPDDRHIRALTVRDSAMALRANAGAPTEARA